MIRQEVVSLAHLEYVYVVNYTVLFIFFLIVCYLLLKNDDVGCEGLIKVE